MQLRPGPASYVRAAHFRQSLRRSQRRSALYQHALDTSDRRDAEGRAWLLVQLAVARDRARRARRGAGAARGSAARGAGVPLRAGRAVGRCAAAAGRPTRRSALADRALAAAPHAERHLLRADALRALGRDEEARQAEDAFERAALANLTRADNENIHLVDFYLDRRPDPERALEIARAEAKRRPDTATLERLARALEHNGLADEARALRARSLQSVRTAASAAPDRVR